MQTFDFGFWDWFLRSVLPALQLPMTILGAAIGAGIGGWVAIKTTTRALEAAAQREHDGHELGRRRARADDLRRNSERYLLILWKMYGFQTDLATAMSHWAAGQKVMTDDMLARMQPPSELLAELMMLEQLHLPFLSGTAFSFGDIQGKLGSYLGNVRSLVKAEAIDWSKDFPSEFRNTSWDFARQMQDYIGTAAAKLRRQVEVAESGMLACSNDGSPSPGTTSPR